MPTPKKSSTPRRSTPKKTRSSLDELEAAQAASLLALGVRGHPNPNYDNAFKPAGEHEGWPRYESAEGLHLYRHI